MTKKIQGQVKEMLRQLSTGELKAKDIHQLIEFGVDVEAIKELENTPEWKMRVAIE
jgi:hypothetical protein